MCAHTRSSGRRSHGARASDALDPSLQVAYGVGVTVIGIALTLGSLGWADAGAIVRYWPIAVVLAGGAAILRAEEPPARVWGWFWVVLGIWLLARTTGHSRVDFWDLVWPIALVALGIRLWLDAVPQGERPSTPAPPLGKSASHMTAILAGSTRVVQEASFTGTSMTSVLGNCTLDLHLSGPPAAGPAVVEVFALLGAHEIVVPEGWTVVTDVTTIGAEIDDQRSSFAGRTLIEGDTRPLVIVKGTLVLSGMKVRH